jgi:signal transduction histidine kinase
VKRSGPRPLLPLATVPGLLAVLALLAVLQNRWISQLSDAERERLRAGLATASAQLCDDFDRELTRAYQVFRLEPVATSDELATQLHTRLARWRANAPTPGIVQDLLVVTRLGGGVVALSRLDETTGRLLPSEWSDSVSSLQRVFTARAPVPLLDELTPGLVLPVRELQPGGEREPRDGGERRPPRDHVIVRLDMNYIRTVLMPRLAATRFGGEGGLNYSVVVKAGDGPERVIFTGGPQVKGAAWQAADIVRPLFSLRFFPELANPQDGSDSSQRAPARPPAPDQPRRTADGQRPPPPRGPEDRAGSQRRPGTGGGFMPPAGAEAGRWLLEVRHPAGSLEAAVTGARRRNLGISLAIVALLGTVGVLMVVSTRRAQRLANQQMNFVASVSHELRTPLTAMRSAGQNLADGIVDDPERVRSYGALIEQEGRRLTDMVSRVLAFAEVQSGPPAYRMQPVAVHPLIESVLSDSRWILEERQFQVEAHVADDLPEVQGDPAALRQVLANLVDNAMKYGAPARWIGVRANLVVGPRGTEVAIAVSDRGFGIRRADLSRIFDPFSRGTDAKVAATPGSGLGLAVVRSIVEAHGGRITVDSAPGRGSTFTVYLPVARDTGKGG